MLVTSFQFLLFFPLISVIYYLVPKQIRWIYLLVVSYIFYINWQPIYAILLFGVTIVTYLCAIAIDNVNLYSKSKKTFLFVGCLIPLLFLGIFKYYNFINQSVFHWLDVLGLHWQIPKLKILLPIGISFYTFMAVGYLVDVYRGLMRAERNLGYYALFISYFPHITSGPIGRANRLLPQFKQPSSLNYDNFISGLRMMVWGYFMKLCVADRLSMYVDAVYSNIPQHNGTTLLLASLFYTIQIYGDFAGYSFIAIGASRIMGIKLMDNFIRPYFAHNIKEFWGRWHISLSTWFRDYLYIPLGGNRVSPGRHVFNLFITFIVSGLWHGAAWNYILWGGVHGIYQIIMVLLKNVRLHLHIPIFVNIIFTFICVNFAWVLFRVDTSQAINIYAKIFSSIGLPFVDIPVFSMGLLSLLILFIKDSHDEYGWGVDLLASKYRIISYTTIIVLIIYILLYGVLDGGQFIYFQF